MIARLLDMMTIEELTRLCKRASSKNDLQLSEFLNALLKERAPKTSKVK
jgi:hypothetical protein